MGRRRRRATPTRGNWFIRFARGARPDRNPLRRTSDRVETWVLGVSLLSAVVAAPFVAHLTADASRSAAIHAQRSEAAAEHKAMAVLLQRAPSDSGVYSMDPGVLTRATWSSGTGVVHTGQVLAPPGAPRGTSVTVWTDAAGNLASAPLTDSQVAGQADLASTATVIGIVVLFGCEILVVRHVVNRRRLAAWDADWAVTGPAWNRQRW